MKYRESKLDQENRSWFVNDSTKQTLSAIQLKLGELRGLSPFRVDFKFPITAIAGKNGSGKSTLLAIAACGFHNNKKGYKLSYRKHPYYTFQDFFIQSAEEVPPQGISIDYHIYHNNWKVSPQNTEKVGIRYQTRYKKKGGRWNDYSTRVKRDVVFFGIERVVPHSEKSVSKSYRNSFKKQVVYGWEENVKDIVGRILGKEYNTFEYAEYTKYRLPIVSTGGVTYSGFNMGAGENALFEIFSVIFSCNVGALIVIDEIELGLHAEAQIKLIKELKSLCLQRKIQIICTTHSKHIFEELPMDARLFLERIGGATRILTNISSAFAFGKLASVNSRELDIFVEDKTAFAVVTAVLPNNIRNRVNIEIIGSASALARQMAAIRVRADANPFLVIFDGDQEKNKGALKTVFLGALEKYQDKSKEEEWFDAKVAFLPGKEWPERWILQKCIDECPAISVITKCEPEELKLYISSALSAPKHAEFYHLAKYLNLNPEVVLDRLCTIVAINCISDFTGILSMVSGSLP